MTTTTDVPAGQDPLLTEVAAAVAAAKRASAAAGWQTSDGAVLDGIRDLARLRGHVEALHLSLVRELDSRGLAASAPVATTPEGFLRTTCLVGAGQARRDVAAARATAPGQPLEAMARELADGTRTRAHVDVGVRCLDRLPRSVLAQPRAAEVVVGFLRTAADGASPLDMDRAARQLLARLDPDGSEARDRFDPSSYERRFLDVHTDSTGMVVGSFQLDPVAGATFRTALETCSAPTAGADGAPDRRKARERRADALVAVADTALGVAAPRRGERPRVVVHVELDQLEAATDVSASSSRPSAGWPGQSEPAGLSAPGWASLEDGEPVAPRLLRRFSCDAVLQRVMWSPSLGPLDVGREHRLVTLAQRRALEARDGGCVVPGCSVPATLCDAHHVVHWVDGGPSDLGNYVLACPGHHTAIHAGTWAVTVEDGQVYVTPPRRVDPTRTPRLPQRHAVRRALRALRTPRPAAATGSPAAAAPTPSGEAAATPPAAAASGSPGAAASTPAAVGEKAHGTGHSPPAALDPGEDPVERPVTWWDRDPGRTEGTDADRAALRRLFRDLPSHPVRAGP